MPPRLSIRLDPTVLNSSLSTRQHLSEGVSRVKGASDLAENEAVEREQLLDRLKAKAVVLVRLVTNDVIEAGQGASIIHEDRTKSSSPNSGVAARGAAVAQFSLETQNPHKFQNQNVEREELTLLRGAGDQGRELAIPGDWARCSKDDEGQGALACYLVVNMA